MYIPGDYYVICDRCGFKKRVSQTRKEWNGLLVCTDCWEPRHPQDFVKAKRDIQRVPIARPDKTTTLRTTALSGTAAANAGSFDVADATNISDGTALGITLDNGDIQWTFASDDPSGSTVSVNDKLWSAASSGNTVYMSSATGDTFITASDVSASDL